MGNDVPGAPEHGKVGAPEKFELPANAPLTDVLFNAGSYVADGGDIPHAVEAIIGNQLLGSSPYKGSVKKAMAGLEKIILGQSVTTAPQALINRHPVDVAEGSFGPDDPLPVRLFGTHMKSAVSGETVPSETLAERDARHRATRAVLARPLPGMDTLRDDRLRAARRTTDSMIRNPAPDGLGPGPLADALGSFTSPPRGLPEDLTEHGRQREFVKRRSAYRRLRKQVYAMLDQMQAEVEAMGGDEVV